MTKITGIGTSGRITAVKPTVVGWTLVAALLIARIPAFVALTMIVGDSSRIYGPLFEIISYVLTGGLIILERKRLEVFNIDTIALALLLLAKPAETLLLPLVGGGGLPMSLPGWQSLVVWGTALAVSVVLVLTRTRLRRLSLRSFIPLAIGLVIGFILAAVVVLLTRQQSQAIYRPPLIQIASQALILFPYQMGYAAVTEEPIFRGFLWGYLRKGGVPDRYVWIIQAMLFMLAHLYYAKSYPISFWVTVPLGGLVLGALAWKCHSISSSVIAHGVVNSTSRLCDAIFQFIHV